MFEQAGRQEAKSAKRKQKCKSRTSEGYHCVLSAAKLSPCVMTADWQLVSVSVSDEDDDDDDDDNDEKVLQLLLFARGAQDAQD